jgi:hypothetical protein
MKGFQYTLVPQFIPNKVVQSTREVVKNSNPPPNSNPGQRVSTKSVRCVPYTTSDALSIPDDAHGYIVSAGFGNDQGGYAVGSILPLILYRRTPDCSATKSSGLTSSFVQQRFDLYRQQRVINCDIL